MVPFLCLQINKKYIIPNDIAHRVKLSGRLRSTWDGPLPVGDLRPYLDSQSTHTPHHCRQVSLQKWGALDSKIPLPAVPCIMYCKYFPISLIVVRVQTLFHYSTSQNCVWGFTVETTTTTIISFTWPADIVVPQPISKNTNNLFDLPSVANPNSTSSTDF